MRAPQGGEQTPEARVPGGSCLRSGLPPGWSSCVHTPRPVSVAENHGQLSVPRSVLVIWAQLGSVSSVGLLGSDDGGPWGCEVALLCWCCLQEDFPQEGGSASSCGKSWGGHCRGCSSSPNPLSQQVRCSGLRKEKQHLFLGDMALWDSGRQEAACGLQRFSGMYSPGSQPRVSGNLQRMKLEMDLWEPLQNQQAELRLPLTPGLCPELPGTGPGPSVAVMQNRLCRERLKMKNQDLSVATVWLFNCGSLGQEAVLAQWHATEAGAGGLLCCPGEFSGNGKTSQWQNRCATALGLGVVAASREYKK